MQQKSRLVTRLGCGCLWAYVLMVGLVFAHMLVVWPLASSLGLGRWVRSASGKRDSYTFLFGPDYDWIPSSLLWMALLISAVGGIALGFYARRLKESADRARHERRKPLGGAIPQLCWDRPEEFFQLIHSEPLPARLALDVETDAEQKARLKTARLGALTGMAVLAGIHLSNATSPWFFDSQGPSLGRVTYLFLCCLPAIYLARIYVLSLRQSLQLDERLLLDFEEQKLSLEQVDPSGKATTMESWRFDELREVRLTRTVLTGSKRLDRLSLLTQEQGRQFILAQAGTQIAPEQAEKLAQRLGIPMILEQGP